MIARRPLAFAAAAVAACALSFSVALAADDPAAVASTAAIDLSIEPPIPASSTPLVGFEEKPILVDGKADASSYQAFSFKPPAGRRFELRLFAPEGQVAMEILRGGATTTSGTFATKRRTMHMSSATEGEEIRVLVRALVPGEVAFKLGAKLYPPETGNN